MGFSNFPGEHAGARERARLGFAQDAIERLFEFSPDAILVTDGNGVMRAANPRVEELFGYASEELIGQPVEMLLPARFRGSHPRHRENYGAHPRTRQMGAALNLYGLRKDGTEIPVDIMLKPTLTADGPAVMTFIRDATEQRTAQEALRLNDARLRSIVESISEYAIYLLDREGHIVTWNPGAERIKGYQADEVVGLHFARFFTDEDIAQGRPAELLRQAIVKNRVEEEGWRVRKDGSRFWANVVITAIRDSTGAVTGFSKTTRDVTEHKQAQEPS
jgi:PAS domain S-box-containing protein